jgi:hypothetical protein
MTSVKGCGYRPIHSVQMASTPRMANSRLLMSRQFGDVMIGHVAEDHPLVHPQRVGGTNHHRRLAAANATQKLNLTAPRITMNSPTKPEVAGSPALAMENSMNSAANFGMVLTTPP